MKLSYRINDRATAQVEGETTEEVFVQIADLISIFDATQVCGACGASDITLVVRRPQGNVYCEAHCNGCHSELTFTDTKDNKGRLFPRRKNYQTGEVFDHEGWVKWQPGSGNGGGASGEEPPF